MRVSIAQAAPRVFTPGPAPPVQQPAWCYRHGSPPIVRPAANGAVVVRQRRATLATASTEVIRKVDRHIELEADLGARTPAPLPLAWRDKYELSPEAPALGGGAFAEVFKVRHRQTLQCFAVKVMHRPNFALRGIERQIEAEIQAMRMAADAAERGGGAGAAAEEGVRHIVRLLDVAEEHDYVFLLLELCEQGDLLRKLHGEPAHRFGEELGATVARQLLLGLRTLHSLGFLHRDIKPDNLLCTGGGVLKIADFGWCSTLQDAPCCLAGTFQYMAPEVLGNVPQTPAVDVWSSGVALYQMLVGKPLLTTYLGPGATQLTECDPHQATAVKQRRLLEEIAATCPPSHDRRPIDLSPTCWDFLRQLLVPEARYRATVESALGHPWLLLGAGAVDARPLAVPAAAPRGRQEQPEQTPEASPAGAEPEAAAPPRSPACTRSKEIRSPSTGRASPSSIIKVPTPLKPRSWDPNRNIAYTPPAELPAEAPPGGAALDQLSPERKGRILMSSERMLTSGDRGLSMYSASPKDTLVDHGASARTPLSRLSPPAPPPRVAYSSCRRKSMGARPSCPSESPEPARACGGRGSAPAAALSSAGRIDPAAAKVLLTKLHHCNEQLQQIQAAMVDRSCREVPAGVLGRENAPPPNPAPAATGAAAAGLVPGMSPSTAWKGQHFVKGGVVYHVAQQRPTPQVATAKPVAVSLAKPIAVWAKGGALQAAAPPQPAASPQANAQQVRASGFTRRRASAPGVWPQATGP